MISMIKNVQQWLQRCLNSIQILQITQNKVDKIYLRFDKIMCLFDSVGSVVV